MICVLEQLGVVPYVRERKYSIESRCTFFLSLQAVMCPAESLQSYALANWDKQRRKKQWKLRGKDRRKGKEGIMDNGN